EILNRRDVENLRCDWESAVDGGIVMRHHREAERVLAEQRYAVVRIAIAALAAQPKAVTDLVRRRQPTESARRIDQSTGGIVEIDIRRLRIALARAVEEVRRNQRCVGIGGG